VLIVGPNGAGKTNLLEATHVAAQGFSPRTRRDTEIVRFGTPGGRIELEGRRAATPIRLEVVLRLGEGRRVVLNGATLPTAERLRAEIGVLVFTPDRLAVVKGGPGLRRAYFDRALGRLNPARASLPLEYAAAVAQRNAALRRVRAGVSSSDAVEPWSEQVAELGTQLVAARTALIAELAPGFAAVAFELGLDAAELGYEGGPVARADLDARLERDLERGTTGIGPHLDDVAVLAGGRDLRSFGSQGEQRTAVLSLLLAEAEVLAARRGVAPLLLLDDVLSELDERRRRVLAERVSGSGQTLVTATSRAVLPLEAEALVEVRPGEAWRV
jgi:DNA replication and repair protein RecF